MFSLCIPTMNRYDLHLSKYLPTYIENELIDEIIICDENGNDVNKIKERFKDVKKLKLYVNDKRLGPFYNKMKCCKIAKNQWIALIDSDNFANHDYFDAMNSFIKSNEIKQETILSPDYASVHFHWEHLTTYPNNVINKQTFKHMKFLDEENQKNKKNASGLSNLMNTGNYVLNKFIIDNIDVNTNQAFLQNSHSFDVVLFNYLCFQQLHIDFYIVKNCRYSHTTSNDSIYIEYRHILQSQAKLTYKNIWEYFDK
tara:strand:+ start:608 stop:1372 length:765 start_codon:yes stop_codon:yes gene_type:complete